MKDNEKMTKLMEKVVIFIWMVLNMMEIGLKINLMELV